MKTLRIHRETVRNLTNWDLKRIAAGYQFISEPEVCGASHFCGGDPGVNTFKSCEVGLCDTQWC